MSRADTQFSEERLEMLCDGIFAMAMTLLVPELKPPDLPRQASSAEILHALREHGLAFLGFALSFLLAGQFWILHHVSFNCLRRANRPLALLTIPFLMFVSLLPLSTSMLTAFSLGDNRSDCSSTSGISSCWPCSWRRSGCWPALRGCRRNPTAAERAGSSK